MEQHGLLTHLVEFPSYPIRVADAPLPLQELAWLCYACQTISNVFWVTNYVTMVTTSLREQTYCMPLLALCSNLGWEFTYAFIFEFDDGGSSDYARYLHYIGVTVNCYVAYLTVKNGKAREWAHAPLIQKNLGKIVVVGILVFTVAEVLFAMQIGLAHSQQWAGCACQLFLSLSMLCQLLTRGSSRGTSYLLWITRFVGTLMFYPQEYLRWKHWPEEYAFWGEPMGLFHLVVFPAIDITYGICLWYIKNSKDDGHSGSTKDGSGKKRN